MSQVQLIPYDPSGQTAVVTPVNSAGASTAEPRHVGPGTPSLAWWKMIGCWSKVDACIGGTESMRHAGRQYLIQHAEESNEAYEERLQKSVFTNFTRQTLNTWTGKPFSEKIRVSDTVPDQIKDLLPDIDLCGNELQVFAREWFWKGLAYAFCHVLVEFPRIDQRDPSVPRTVADDIEEGVRPYFVLIEPQNIIDARREIVNGEERITHIRIKECVLVDGDDPFTQTEVHRIRAYYAGAPGTKEGTVVLYEWQEGSDKKWLWVEIDRWTFNFDGVPLVTFYANRTGFMEGRPHIEDLVDLNIAHFNSESDQVNILTVTRFPQLVALGVSSDKGLVVGPNKVIRLSDPGANLKYVEHQGAAIRSGVEHIQSLEERIESYGTQFLRKQPGRVTATARTLDTAEATSELQDVAIRFSDALNQALQLTAEWIGLEDGGRVDIQTEFGITEGSPESLQVLHQSCDTGMISRQQYVRELQQRGVLSDLFNPQENEAELEEARQLELAAQKELEAAKAPPPAPVAPPASV